MPTGGRAPSLLSIFTSSAGRVRRASSSLGRPVSGNVGPATAAVVDVVVSGALSGSSTWVAQPAATSTSATNATTARTGARRGICERAATRSELLESSDALLERGVGVVQPVEL